MLTPFDSDGTIDFDGLTALTEWYLEAGCAGLFANCLSSEMFELTPDERLQLIDHVVKIANGRVPVVATGTFGGDLQQQAGFIKKVYNKGVDAVIMITGLLARESDSDAYFNEQVLALLNLTENIPLGFYECPVPYKRVITPAQLQLFVATGRIIYHKDTSLNLAAVSAKNKVGSATAGFGLYDAYMAHAVASLKAGSAGLSCIQGNYFPELVVWLCRNYQTPGLANEVAAVQNFFISEMDVMHHAYPAVAKYYLQSHGLNITTLTRRKDIESLTDDTRHRIDALGSRYRQLTEMIDLKPVL